MPPPGGAQPPAKGKGATPATEKAVPAKAVPAKAATPAAPTEATPKAAVPAGPAALVAGEQLLCGDVKGLGVKLVYTPGAGSSAGSFWFISEAATNKKIPPNTKLHLFREGKLQGSQGEGHVAYDLTQPKKNLACVLQSSDRHDLPEPKALDTLINEMKI